MAQDQCANPMPARASLHAPRTSGMHGSRAHRWPLVLLAIIIALLIAVAASPVTHAQTPPSAPAKAPAKTPARTQDQAPPSSDADPMLSSYEGQTVTSIEVAGRPGADASQFTPLFLQQPGKPFSADNVEQTISAVRKAGDFKDVRLQVEPDADGVKILLIPDSAIYFGIFQFPGAEQFPYSRLVQISNFPAQTPYNAGDVEQDRQALLTFFRQEGFFQAEVTPEVQVDSAHGLANIVFHSTLNHRAQFGAVTLENAAPSRANSTNPPNPAPVLDPALSARLHDSLGKFMARARGAAIRPGKSYRRSALNKATKYLQSQLEKDHFLAARVVLAGADYHADTNRADTHFQVRTGRKIDVQITGAHLWSWTRKSLLPVYQGVGVDQEIVQEGRQALISYFQAKGYFDVQVDTQFKRQPTGSTIVYQIAKDKKHKVAAVTLSGNALLPSGDLTPHLSVEKSHLFSPGKFSEKLVKTSVNNLKAVYQSEGFSSVEVASTVTRQDGNIRVSFAVTEGPRDVVDTLTIVGADTFPQSRFAPHGLKLAVGQPYSQKLVQADRASIVAQYLQAGYLNAGFRSTATLAAKDDPHHIDVVYQIHEGPRVYAADVVTLGRAHTQQRLIDTDLASIQPATPLTETQLLTAESQLYNHTGVFDWAEVSPRRQITDQTSEDVLVKVHEGKRNQLTYGFGFEFINRGGSVPSGTVTLPNLPPIGLPTGYSTSQQTFYGPRGTIQFTRNNLRGKGETLSLTGFAGRLDQRAAAYYIDPTFRWSHWRSTLSLSAERNEENPIFSSQAELGSLQFQRTLDKAKLVNLFLRYSFSQTKLTRIEIENLVLPADRNVRLSTLAANLTRDTRDSVLDEHKGVLQSAELDFNSTKLGSSVDFVKFNGQAAYYKQGWHNIVFANSLRIGLAQPFAGSRVPLSEAFFTGGGNSLRGFPLDGAGPQRSVEICLTGGSCACPGPQCSLIQVPSGGNELLLINAEARIPLTFRKGLSIVPFYDGGNVFPNVGFHNFTSLYSNNAGLGLRYATPVGPIRFDLGRNLNPVAGIKATQYFFSIGQAF